MQDVAVRILMSRAKLEREDPDWKRTVEQIAAQCYREGAAMPDFTDDDYGCEEEMDPFGLGFDMDDPPIPRRGNPLGGHEETEESTHELALPDNVQELYNSRESFFQVLRGKSRARPTKSILAQYRVS